MIQFSDTSGKTGIAEQARKIMRVDSTQWPNVNVANSCNNYLDFCAGYLIGNDRRFQWDDTNHTKLPEGTTNLVANQKDYSFLTDEQGNQILNLLRVEILKSDGIYQELELIDQEDIPYALEEFAKVAGIPQYYDKISDNIIRLYPAPSENITAGLKFFFQRTPSYFTASDTTKAPGVPALLHRGFVIASAYDGAMTLGLQNIQALAIEKQVEEQKVLRYFNSRGKGETFNTISAESINSM